MTRREGRTRRLTWALLIGLVVIVGASVAAAQEVSKLGGKVRGGNEVVIPADETVAGDLYVAGGQVRVEGTVEGDLVAMGGQVQISGEVGGDIVVGSGNVDVSGQVGGDARIGAGQLTVGGSIGEDLAVGSGQATITSSGTVGEDFVFGTGQTTIDGRVDGDVTGGTGRYTLRGTIGGIEDVTIARAEERDAGDRLLDALQRFVALLAIGVLLLWLLPRLVDGSAATLRRSPWASLGVGVLGMVGWVVLLVAIFLVMILLAIAFGFLRLDDLAGITVFTSLTTITGVTYVFLMLALFVAHAVVGLVIGGLASRGETGGRRWMALFLGVLAVVLVTSIPVVGGWFGLVLAMFGLGAVILEFWPWRRREPATAAS